MMFMLENAQILAPLFKQYGYMDALNQPKPDNMLADDFNARIDHIMKEMQCIGLRCVELVDDIFGPTATPSLLLSNVPCLLRDGRDAQKITCYRDQKDYSTPHCILCASCISFNNELLWQFKLAQNTIQQAHNVMREAYNLRQDPKTISTMIDKIKHNIQNIWNILNDDNTRLTMLLGIYHDSCRIMNAKSFFRNRLTALFSIEDRQHLVTQYNQVIQAFNDIRAVPNENWHILYYGLI